MLWNKQQFSKAYLSHPVFGEIDRMIELYQDIAYCSGSYIRSGTKCITNYASHIYLSMAGTLESIAQLLKNGRINDAYVLCRKYFDDILTEIYIDIKCKSEVDYFKSIYIEDVDQWMTSSFRIPSIKSILKILKDSSFTRDLYPFFGWKSYLEKNRQLLDNHVHGNFYYSFLYNCSELYLEHRKKHLDNIHIVLKQLVQIHIAFLFYLNSHYFIASDYVDYLDAGSTPPDGSENWIAPYAREAFEYYISKNKLLADFIKQHTLFDWE